MKKGEKKEKPDSDGLTLKQKIFCNVWFDSKGNGTTAALAAFDIKGKEILTQSPPARKNFKSDKVWFAAKKDFLIKQNGVYNTASNMASEYLRKPYIIKFIDEMLDKIGFTDETAKREHFKVLVQDDDLGVKNKAIENYYKLKGKLSDKAKVEGEIKIKWED